MSTTVEERLSQLEDQTRRLHDRLERVEAWVNIPAPRAAPQVAGPGPTRVRSAPPVEPMSRPEPRPEHDLEELLGGRLLALVGGLAVLVGLAFLVALAVERGWLGEEARTVLAFGGSALLLGLGAWLHEHRGRTQASLAACGTGLAGLFLSLTAATVLYDLVPVGPALAGAFVFGAAGAALAVRWDATPIGGLGILGALAAPILTGATHDAQALLFLAIAEAAAVAVLVWRRWDWLRVAAVALVLIEIAAWTFDAEPSATRAFVVLALFGVLNLAAAALALPARALTGKPKLVYAVVGAQIVLAVVHVLAYEAPLDAVAKNSSTSIWPILAIAASTFLVARLTPAKEIEWRATADATALAAVAYGTVVLFHGVALAGAWAVEAVVLVEVGRRLGHRVAAAGALGFGLLAALHALSFEAPPDSLVHGADPFWQAAIDRKSVV